MFRPAACDPPLPLLITGIAGVAGYNAFNHFRAKYPGRVVGIRETQNWRLTGPGVVACNAEDRRGLARLFDEYQFASVLDCAGNCALKPCELDPALAWRINVEGVANLLSVTAPRGVRLVHLSVDLVYSGVGAGGYVEDDPTDPVTVYGKTMVAAEELDPPRRPERLHPADLAADGRQLQRARRGDRLDRVAVQEVAAGHALLRRDPHADLHRLPERPVRRHAGQRRRRASSTPADRGG